MEILDKYFCPPEYWIIAYQAILGFSIFIFCLFIAYVYFGINLLKRK